MVRVVIDTNVWISCMIGKRLRTLEQHIDNQEVVVLTCTEQQVELADVSGRRKFRRYVTKNKVDEFMEFFNGVAEVVPIVTTFVLCRDKKDDYLLSLAVDGAADYLVTGDMDLLSLKTIGGTTIVRYTDFELLMETL